MTIRASSYTKGCVVRCANSGSLMMKGHEPTPPALTEFRHVIEFEPDDRALVQLSDDGRQVPIADVRFRVGA